ncbi:NlpC/P60 family protein [Photobacterium sp. GSS17]|uniref:NlpC/P60 family protein n=1 Tax=Photobacterium sp. GSS17 TaxID=3020715 RepID=UPI0023618339|nr:NlpC/P60 family protein [Photobacterium sp. GSS17]
MLCDPRQFEGKPYVSGSHDCYGSFRDLFLAATGEILPDFARPEGWWDHPDLNLIEDYFSLAGFEDTGFTVNGARPMHVLLFAVASSKINHIGLYLGNGQFFHHQYQRLSIIEPLDGSWKSRCVKVLTHANAKQHAMGNLQQHFEKQPIYAKRRWLRG